MNNVPKFQTNFKIPSKRPPETISELTGGTNSFMIAKVESLDMATIDWKDEEEADDQQPVDQHQEVEEAEQTDEIELGEYQMTEIPLPPMPPPSDPMPPPSDPTYPPLDPTYPPPDPTYPPQPYVTESFYGDQATYAAYTVPPPPVFDNFPKLELGPQLYQSPLFNLDETYMGSGDSVHRTAVPLKDQTEARKRRAMDSVIDLCVEDTYPDELKQLMKPLVCNLCNSSMNSVISSKMHYQSKQHEKKIVAWLASWFVKTGERIERKRVRVAQPVEGPTGPDAFHCKVCDLKLTSVQHANQHYMGKKHRQAAAGRKNPAGSGYWHEGVWVRQQTKVATDSRFGIGASFVAADHPPPPPPPSDEAPAASSPAKPTNADNKVSSSTPPATKTSTDSSKFCEICMITVTSDSQMKMHLEGIKHAKKLKSLGSAPYAPPTDTILSSVLPQPPSSHYGGSSSNNSRTGPTRDISIYRTPSGQFYCGTCDMTVLTESLMLQHLDSKKHIKTLKSPH